MVEPAVFRRRPIADHRVLPTSPSHVSAGPQCLQSSTVVLVLGATRTLGDVGELPGAQLLDDFVDRSGLGPDRLGLVHGQPSPHTPGGVKGMGEGGTVGAPAAIANAVADALRPLGVSVTRLPLLPEDLRRSG